MLTEAAGSAGKSQPNSSSVDDEDLDEFDLYPGTLELPNLRSPRGSINSNYGSRHGSTCSQGSNSSTLSWTSLQALRRIANQSRAGSIVGKVSQMQTHLYEHSMTYGDCNPDEYRQTLVESYFNHFSVDEYEPPVVPPPTAPPISVATGSAAPPPAGPANANLLAISASNNRTRRGSPAGNAFFSLRETDF